MTFKEVEIGRKVNVEHYVFPFTEVDELTIVSKVPNGDRLKIECVSKGGAKYWFEVGEEDDEFYNEVNAYEHTKVTII